MPHRKRGYRFENDWPPEHQEHIAQNYKSGVTIPVDLKIEQEHHVLNMENVKKILSNARTISVMDCGCRLMYGHCDKPVNVCFDLDELAEHNISNGLLGSRKITYDEALQILHKTHEAGLVHMAYGHGEFYEPGVINSVCSCCSCCCGILAGVLRFGLYPQLLTSHSTSVTDSSNCTSCGVCVDRCPFGAKEKLDGNMVFKPELCFGCGLCVSTCPTHAIKLVNK